MATCFESARAGILRAGATRVGAVSEPWFQDSPHWPNLEGVDTSEHDQRVALVIRNVADLMANLRRERARRNEAGEDTTWLDQALAEMQPVVEQTHDLETFQAIKTVVARHGGGAYPIKDLAAIAGIEDLESLSRVLDQMVAEGLAEPPGDTPA